MILFHPELLHASAGFVHGEPEPASERMSLTFRVAPTGIALHEEAFLEARGHRDAVLRVISLSSRAVT